MPLNGIDHVELWVGNAAQAAYFYREALGFRAGRLRGPRDRRPRPRLARAPAGPDPARAHRRARPGHEIAPPPRPRRRREGHRAVGARRRPRLPRRRSSAAPRASRAARGDRRARHRPPGDDRHLRRHAPHVRRAHRLQGPVPARLRRRPTAHGDDGLLAIDHIVGNVELGHMDDVGQVLRGRLRDDGDDPLLRRGHLDRVLRADVEGRHRRQRPHQVPDQRARRGQAQVADRRVPRVLRRRRRAAHRGRHARHRRHGRPSCASAASSS